jgi:hypothetical protein
VSIEPSEVRLITSEKDPYSWRQLDDRNKDLFSKNLSDHSIGAYRRLCDGIGKTFEAVPVQYSRIHFVASRLRFALYRLRLYMLGIDSVSKFLALSAPVLPFLDRAYHAEFAIDHISHL